MKEQKKFRLTSNFRITAFGVKLFQIEALVDIETRNVKKGDLGGYIEKEENLYGNAWVYGDAEVYGNAKVYGDAEVCGNAKVYGDAEVCGNAKVYGDAEVYGNAKVYGDAEVYGNAKVYGDAEVCGNAKVSGNAWVYGDAEVYGNAKVSGDAEVYGNAKVSGNAKVCGELAYTRGWFIGGDDSGKITDITAKTGTDYWQNQYVLGDYEINEIEEKNAESNDPDDEPHKNELTLEERVSSLENRLRELEEAE